MKDHDTCHRAARTNAERWVRCEHAGASTGATGCASPAKDQPAHPNATLWGASRIQMARRNAGDCFHTAVARVSAPERWFVADIGQSENLICQKWPISPKTFAKPAHISGALDPFFIRVKMKIDGMAGKGRARLHLPVLPCISWERAATTPWMGVLLVRDECVPVRGGTDRELKRSAHPLQPVAFNIPVRRGGLKAEYCDSGS